MKTKTDSAKVGDPKTDHSDHTVTPEKKDINHSSVQELKEQGRYPLHNETIGGA